MSESVKVTLPDGTQKEAPRGIRVGDFVREKIGQGLAKAAYVARLDGEPVDLSRPIDRDVRLEVVTTRNPEALEVARANAAALRRRGVLLRGRLRRRYGGQVLHV